MSRNHLLIEDIDDEDALDGVLLDVAHLADSEVAEGDAWKVARTRPRYSGIHCLGSNRPC